MDIDEDGHVDRCEEPAINLYARFYVGICNGAVLCINEKWD